MRFATLALAAALAAGCSSSSSSSSSTSGDGGANAANLTTASFDMNVSVGAGQELFKCQFVTLPDVQAFMVSGQHQYTPGSHHLLLYTTDLTSIPAGGDQVQDCYEGTGSTNIMSHARGVLYAGQVPNGSETLPQGVGISTSPKQVLLFQVHYINATAAALDAKVHVQLSLDTGDDIITKAGIFFFYDPFIDVPAGATAKATMRCLIPDQVTLVYASSHYHARGVGYGAYLDPSATEMAPKPFYTSNSWSSPPNQQMSMTLPAGSHLRFECDYDNSSGTAEYFQGQSALTNEMCMFIGTYYPEMTQIADYCLSGPDMFGTGSVSCGDTLTCLEACGSITFGRLGGGGVSECEQKCIVQSCPSASAPLVPVVECVRSSCSTECGTGATGSGCSTCLQAKCASQAQSCMAHACN
ncbi:MAG TPA: hypothetical protein VF765_06330 [Polyangiaceae bacterium]